MNQDAVDIWAAGLEAVFEERDDLVHALHWQLVGEGAVAGERNFLTDAADVDFMDVDDFGQGAGGGAKQILHVAIVGDSGGVLDSGGFILDMGEDGTNLGEFAADLVFNAADEFVGIDEGQILRNLNVLFDFEAGAGGLHADVVEDDIVAGCDGANLVKDAFGAGGAWDGMNDDIGAGCDALDSEGGVVDQLFTALEGEVARHGEGEVGEVACAIAAHAELVDGQDALDGADFAEDAVEGFTRDGVSEDVDGAVGDAPTERDDEARDDDGGERVGVTEPVEVEVLAEPRGAEADEDGGGGPDVRGEVLGFGFKGGAAVAAADCAHSV